MIFVVVGPITSRFARPATNIVARGARTLHRFTSAKVPCRPEAVPSGDLAPGYVTARMAGSAVWRPK